MSSDVAPHGRRPTSVRRAWFALPLIVLPTLVILIDPLLTMPRWALMWILCGAIFIGCKVLTLSAVSGLSVTGRLVGYLLAWPGLDAVAFLDQSRRARPPRWQEWIAGGCAVLAGVVAVWIVVPLAVHDLVQGWIGMIGIVLLLHFGSFRLLSCAWRRAGVDARPLMDAPIMAMSVSEFWGRRWNTAFRDATHRFLFGPIALRWGPRWGIGVGFLVSGLVHDLVISLPAGAGYGLPTLYFCLQAVGMVVERSGPGRRLGCARGVTGWLWTVIVVALPAGLLFHPPFIRNVILPFLDVLAAR